MNEPRYAHFTSARVVLVALSIALAVLLAACNRGDRPQQPGDGAPAGAGAPAVSGNAISNTEPNAAEAHRTGRRFR